MSQIQELVDFFSLKGKIFQSIKKIEVKALGSRKKISIFVCVDLKSFYHVIFYTKQKSRFLIAHAKEIIALESRVCALEEHNNKYKHVCIEQELCSKAKQYLKERGWSVHNDFM
jgi:hypothetical protein